jgi:6-phosphogluconate dehydrogenase
MSKIAIVGLGRMGGNMARRLRQGGAEVVAYNRNHAVAQQLAAETGLVAVETLPLLVESLGGEGRMIWLMLPAGDATQQALKTLIPLLGAGDIVVDGANAFYKDSQRRAKELETWGIRFVDVGVSGGGWGLKNGYAMMIGGEAEAVRQLEYFLKILAPAPDKGWLHCGPAGAGHFVKMIHNGIEYGMMQAFAEGFALMKGKQEFDLDLAAIS